MEQKPFIERSPRNKQEDKAVSFSSGVNALNDYYKVRDNFKPFGVDFHSFSRNDILIAKEENGIEEAFDAFCEFIQKIDKKGYDELILFGKSFGGFWQLLAMQNIPIQGIRTKIKIVCAPAFIDPTSLVQENKIVLPDGETDFEIHKTNKIFLFENIIEQLKHDTLLIIGEEDNAQNLDELKKFKEQNKDHTTLKIMPKCNHFNLLENLSTLHQIMKFLKIKSKTSL